jgi:hypothetical protein
VRALSATLWSSKSWANAHPIAIRIAASTAAGEAFMSWFLHRFQIELIHRPGVVVRFK